MAENHVIIASKDFEWSYRLYNKLNALELKDTKFTLAFCPQDIRYDISCAKEENARIRIVYFHWSEYITKEFFDNYECITIHTSNLPHGRGGTPIQNQILDGIRLTHVNALKTTAKLDVGPIYASAKISLQGSLSDIWMAIADGAAEVIWEIIAYNLTPIIKEDPHDVQKPYKRLEGAPNPFDTNTLEGVYDRIRMVDAPGYPDAQVTIGGFVVDFTNARFTDNKEVLCNVKIRKS